MSPEEISFYSRLDLQTDDLLDFYQHYGLSVASIPWSDPAHVRRNPKALREKEQRVSAQALERYDALPKPVLLHCSAGIDRSSPVAAFIRAHRSQDAVPQDEMGRPASRAGYGEIPEAGRVLGARRRQARWGVARRPADRMITPSGHGPGFVDRWWWVGTGPGLCLVRA